MVMTIIMITVIAVMASVALTAMVTVTVLLQFVDCSRGVLLFFQVPDLARTQVLEATAS